MFGHRSRLRIIPVVFTFLAPGLVSSPASAQSNNRIAGAVSDPLNAPIGGAKVELLLDAKSVTTTTTSTDGGYSFDNLAEGRYQVRVNAAGFQARTSDPIFVGRSGTARADLTLPLGPLETAVSVTAAATDVLPSQVGAAVTVFDGPTLNALGKLDIIEALRLAPGSLKFFDPLPALEAEIKGEGCGEKGKDGEDFRHKRKC